MPVIPRLGYPRIFLILMPVFGVAALILGTIGLVQARPIADPWWDYWTGIVIDAFSLLILAEPDPQPEKPTYAAARIFAVLFFASGATGVILELSRPARDLLRRLRFFGRRNIRRKKAATIIGLGWIGQPLAADLLQEGRPVSGVTLDENSPRAARAHEKGVLVVSGNANDPSVRKRAGLKHAREVFIATGSDTRNIDIAGDLLPGERADSFKRRDIWRFGRMFWRRKRRPLHCYVHVGDPSISVKVRDHDLLCDPDERISFQLFSNPDLAARDLFFHEENTSAVSDGALENSNQNLIRHYLEGFLRSGTLEVPHLFLFGFGSVGQAVALAVARFAHLPSRLRPRLTVYDDFESPAKQDVLNAFRHSHPAFSPASLDLTDEDDFLKAGDSWKARPGDPAKIKDHEDTHYDEIDVEHHGTAVEYAVNAEFQPLSLDAVDVPTTIEEIRKRIEPKIGPPVRSAAVFCLEEEWQSLQAALGLQQALACRFVDDNADHPYEEWSGPAELPIYIYLPVEAGFSQLISNRTERLSKKSGRRNREDRVRRETELRFPLRAFGKQKDVNSYESVTGAGVREQAEGLRAAHAVLAGRGLGSHPDFESSDFDAALHAFYVKAPALGIRLVKRERQRGSGELLLEALWNEGVVRAHEKLKESVPETDDGKLVLTAEELHFDDRPNIPDSVKTPLRQRLVLLDDIYIPKKEESESEAERRYREQLVCTCGKAAEEVIAMFERELDSVGRKADLAAEMEHNRWLGERLSKGWRFGERSNLKRQRTTFVPWEDLRPTEKHYDRIHLPKLVLECCEQLGMIPVIEQKDQKDQA